MMQRRQAVIDGILQLDAQIKNKENEITQLKESRLRLIQEKDQLLSAELTSGKPLAINYTVKHDWHQELMNTMTRVFNIHKFRLCQQGVCNANMDGRDIVCVMPTGGGKSLTFQLPAIVIPGTTLVISPLISLMTDQIMHLHEANVPAVMLSADMGKDECKAVKNRLRGYDDMPEIKLCYVTPERIAKDNSFLSVLDKLAKAGKLARIVIDEAHCVSQMGQNFRPDYKNLGLLRRRFRDVPILALTATCPPLVLADLLKVLHMAPITHGHAANEEGTVYFTAPLYRKNLHYRVVRKVDKSSSVIKDMVDYITRYHKDHSGIIYCLSQKDAAKVAADVRDVSKGLIRTGVYHADIKDGDKIALHHKWRRGEIKVICATIAFGMGIDKSDVRFVLHHSISKTLDGFFQETGRAGRDGQDADCVLYYRPQDWTRMCTLISKDDQGQEKLQHMIRFAFEMKECRKNTFENYFAASAYLSLSSAKGSNDRCGHCDNCSRREDEIEEKRVTLEAWKLVVLADYFETEGQNITVTQLAGLARGKSSVKFDKGNGYDRHVSGGSQTQSSKHISTKIGCPIGLSKDDTETLIIYLIMESFLEMKYQANPYVDNVYVRAGRRASELRRFSLQNVEDEDGPDIHLCFSRPRPPEKALASGAKKRKKALPGPSRNIVDDDYHNRDNDETSVPTSSQEESTWTHTLRPRKKPRMTGDVEIIVDDDVEIIGYTDSTETIML